jgi:hypothetical protein
LRPVWVAVLALLLVGILRLVGRFERPPTPRPPPAGDPPPHGPVTIRAATLAAGAVVAICAGLVTLTVGGLNTGPAAGFPVGGPVGLPLLGLTAYLGGLVLLRTAVRAGRPARA